MVSFLTAHLGYPDPVPGDLRQDRDGVPPGGRRASPRPNHIPVVRFAKGDRKIEVMRPLPGARLPRPGRSGVAAIGVAQEFAAGVHRPASATPTRASRRSSPSTRPTAGSPCYYFYLWDDDFGPAFIKVCAYFPYPIKIWINGHEWAKRQAATAGIGFTELSNGFATTDDPAGLQAICDRLGPGTINVFCPALVGPVCRCR